MTKPDHPGLCSHGKDVGFILNEMGNDIGEFQQVSKQSDFTLKGTTLMPLGRDEKEPYRCKNMVNTG